MTTETNTHAGTDTHTEADHQALIDGYFDCWNLTDPDERQAAVARTWGEEATSSDPLNEVSGHADLAAMFAAAQESYPGHRFQQVGVADTHHRLVRWGWEMLDTAGSKVLDGIDVALIGDDGRISYLAGFFGADIPADRAV